MVVRTIAVVAAVSMLCTRSHASGSAAPEPGAAEDVALLATGRGEQPVLGGIPSHALAGFCAATEVWIGTVSSVERYVEIVEPTPSWTSNQMRARIRFTVERALLGGVEDTVTGTVRAWSSVGHLPKPEPGRRYIIGRAPRRDGSLGWAVAAELDPARELPTPEVLEREMAGWSADHCVCGFP